MNYQANNEEIYISNSDQLQKNIENNFFNFLTNFELNAADQNYIAYAEQILDKQDGQPINYYKHKAQQMREQEKQTMYVDFTHLGSFRHEDPEFLKNLVGNFNRCEPALRKALTKFMQLPSMADNQSSIKKTYYQLAIYNLPSTNKIRELRTQSLGRLMSILGTVTRSTDAKPELILGTFQCLECSSFVQNIEQQFKYTEPVRCSNEQCQNKIRWDLINKDSTMVDWQKIRMQELSSDIPAGSMPRSIDVILRGEIVDLPKPGDKAVFTGKLVVVPDIVQLLKPGEKYTSQNSDTTNMRRNDAGKTMDGVQGLKKIGVKDLSYKFVFIACSVQCGDTRFGVYQANDEEDDSEENWKNNFTLHERHEVMRMKNQDDLYTKLANSIAPSVHGHLDIKKGVMLQLFGGIPKKTIEGIKLRGDINICIVGDPATAKSQFLKYICQFLPRAVYTSGKASSAAGLTASVVKDPETGDFCIEAGALMLADHGICCIDEFDKMDGKDQVAIHEAMEQQTISIAKAGIHATLNARASILAAANPIFGRYDRTRSLRYNVNITPPLMSRFDIFFVIFDEKNDQEDYNIAHHIVNMHRLRDEAINPDFKMEQVQTYIKFARHINPTFSQESAKILKDEYKMMRARDKGGDLKRAYKVTVRQLESLIRLSEAMARVHLDTIVRPVYVKEVCRLLRNSNININKSDIEFEEMQKDINLEQENLRQNDDQAMIPQEPVQQEERAEPSKKTKISYEEYQKLTVMIVEVMKEFQRNNQDNVQQLQIINRMVQRMEVEDLGSTSVEKSIETSKKIQNVISYLISKENLLMISQDSKLKNERFLCLNINVDMQNLNIGQ